MIFTVVGIFNERIVSHNVYAKLAQTVNCAQTILSRRYIIDAAHTLAKAAKLERDERRLYLPALRYCQPTLFLPFVP
jgi:hypothetical protein